MSNLLIKNKLLSNVNVYRQLMNGTAKFFDKDLFTQIKPDALEAEKSLQEFAHANFLFQQSQQLHPFKAKHSFKWLADKLDTDLKEVRLNFNYFKQNVQNIPFAIIQLDNEAIESQEMMEKLGESFAFLQQLDMSIVLVLGKSRLTNMNLDSLKALKVKNEVLIHSIMGTFSKYGIRTLPIFNGSSLFTCQSSSQNKYHGEITNINVDFLNHCFSTQQIPIINSIGESMRTNQYLYLDSNHLVTSLAMQLKPFKIIKLNLQGGLRDTNDKLVLNINITRNADFIEMDRIEKRIKELKNNSSVDIKLIKSLLSKMPNYTSYVVTSINEMIAELFTNSGRGTFFKLSETILVTNDFRDLDEKKMTSLLEMSFNKRLKPSYFNVLAQRKPVIFYDENYSALAIATTEINHCPYLDKFCIAPQNQVIINPKNLELNIYQVVNENDVVYQVTLYLERRCGCVSDIKTCHIMTVEMVNGMECLWS